VKRPSPWPGPPTRRTILGLRSSDGGDETVATRVLIVEDHSLFAQALELVLGQALADEGGGAEFARAATVSDGLRIADRDGPFGLAVVDLVLPDGNGADLVRELKAAYPETRVAVLSAVSDLSGSLEAGADDAISKMVPLPEIVARLETLARAGVRPGT
jgi:DNA-binding response OmpR family regulator